MLAIKRKNESISSEDSMPSLLAFGEISFLPVINEPLQLHRERITAIASAKAKMAAITAKTTFYQAFRFKPSPATQIHFEPGNHIIIYT